MSRSDESLILVAEVNRVEAKRLARVLKALSCTVCLASSGEEVIELLRTEVFHAGLVAVELQIGKDSVLAYLSRLLALRCLVGVGSADDPDAEVRARLDGAQVYLTRPVTSGVLLCLPWTTDPDYSRSSSGSGHRTFSENVHDKGQTSSFSPLSLPGL